MDLSSINQELDKLEKRLTDLSSRYKDRFPEIRTLKHQIAAMEKMRDQRLADLKTKASSTQTDVKPAAPAGDSTDVKNQPQVLQLQSQLQANQAEIRNREQTIAALTSKI